MSCNKVEDSIVQGEVVRNASLVANHLAHCSFGDLSCIDVRKLEYKVGLHENKQEHLPHVDKLT